MTTSTEEASGHHESWGNAKHLSTATRSGSTAVTLTGKKRSGGCLGKSGALCIAHRVAAETGAAAVGNSLADPLQTKHRSLRWFSSSTSDYGSKWTAADIQRLVHEYSSWQIFKTSSKVESIQLPSSGWVAQSNSVYPHDGILACHERQVSRHEWLSQEQAMGGHVEGHMLRGSLWTQY